jgi:hypothetical protein
MLRKILHGNNDPNTSPTSAAATGSSSSSNKKPSKIEALLSNWKQLDNNLSSFERLASMRRLVVEGELGAESYDLLHGLAVERATGKERRPSVLGTLQGVEQPIMAGYLYHRTQKTWKKRYVLLFTGRLEYHSSKATSEQKIGQGQYLTLNEKHFVGDSASRHLKNDKENSFMVSDFTTTHYFAAESPELRKYWMHTLARTIKKLQAAKEAFDQQQPSIVGRLGRSPSVVEREYQERLNAYASSIGAPVNTLQKKASTLSPLPTSTNKNNNTSSNTTTTTNNNFPNGNGDNSERSSNARLQSVRLLEEAANIETKRLEHVALQILFEEEASNLAVEAEKVQDKTEEFQRIEKKRIAVEERAGLEAAVAAEFQELVEAKESESAEVLARAEIEKEINRRSVGRPKSMRPPVVVQQQQQQQPQSSVTSTTATSDTIPPPPIVEVDIAPSVEEVVATEDDDVEEAEFKTMAVEAAARRVDEERDQRLIEAKQAMKQAEEIMRAAAEARAKAAELHSKTITDNKTTTTTNNNNNTNVTPVELSPDAALLKAQAERAVALQKAAAMQKYLLQSKEALEKSKQKAQAKMGGFNNSTTSNNNINVGGLTKQPSQPIKVANSATPSSNNSSSATTTNMKSTATTSPTTSTTNTPNSPILAQVDHEIIRVLELIGKFGTKPPGGGKASITFGNLCKAYDQATAGVVVTDDDNEENSSSAAYDISGLLLQCKRLRRVRYDGSQLFRGTHDNVVISLFL